jgi:putative membrane protein
VPKGKTWKTIEQRKECSDMVYLTGVSSVLARFGGGGEFGQGGPGPPWMLPVMMFLGAIFVFLFVLVLFLLVRYFYRTEIAPRKSVPLTPLEILQRRYAAGEISSEDFEKIKRGLGETGG